MTATGDEFELDRLTWCGTPAQLMIFVIEHPAIVESLLAGTDWACAPDGVHAWLQALRDAQQQVLAAGGGTVTVTDDDGTYAGHVATS